MGLKNSTSNGTYIRFKDGKFYVAKDLKNPDAVGYPELEGTITKFNIVDDEFEGQVIRKLVINLQDEEGENYILSIGFESVYATQLISFLKNADLKEKLSLVGMLGEEKDGKRRTSILVKQNGTFLKSHYTKDNPNGIPALKQITVNKKKVWDKAEMLDFLENVVLNEFNSDLTPATFEGQTKEKAPALVEADDLPF